MYDPNRPFVAAQADDEKNLELLAIFHYVVGGLVALLSCMFIVHVVMGLVMLISPDTMSSGGSSPPPPAFMGGMFVVMGAIPLILGWVTGACIIFAGRCLTKRVRHTFCMVTAGLACLFMPLGTALGVFTFILLTKPHIRAQFR